MRKDLAAAHVLAAEQHDLDYFKEVLQAFMEAREQERALLEEREHEKAQRAAEKAANKKISRKPSKAALVNDGEDVEMPDASDDGESGTIPKSAAKPAKRPRDEDGNVRNSCLCHMHTDIVTCS